jgi:hypothetical protein
MVSATSALLGPVSEHPVSDVEHVLEVGPDLRQVDVGAGSMQWSVKDSRQSA